VPYSQKINISDSITELFPLIPTTDNGQFGQQTFKIKSFLRGLRTDQYIYFQDTAMSDIVSLVQISKGGFLMGLKYLLQTTVEKN